MLRIGFGAFNGCYVLTEITLPFIGEARPATANTHFGYIFGASTYSDNKNAIPAVRTVRITNADQIADNAFYDCTTIVSVSISGNITEISDYAFYGCTLLTNINLPNSITKINSFAFYNCNRIKEFVISDKLTHISNHAFYNCSKLTSIKYRGTQAQWNAISKASNWDSNTGNYTITYNYTGE